MCSCGNTGQKAVYTSAQAQQDLAAQQAKEALIAAAENATSVQNAQANAGAR